MTTLNKVLLAALGVQGLLLVVTRWPSGGPSEPRDLVPFGTDKIASVKITGRTSREEKPPGPPVELTQKDGVWVISSFDGFPAEQSMVQPLLDAIDGLTVRDPVATRKASHSGLAVDEASFTRKMELTSTEGEKLTFYLGAAQGKTTQVRVDGEDEVFSVRGFTAWSIADAANRYFERDLLKIDPETVDSVTVQRPAQPPIEFKKGGDGTWTLASLAEGQRLDQTATNSFLTKLLTVRIVDPVSATATPEMGLDGPTATTVSWSTAGGTPTKYRIGSAVPEKNNRFYLLSDTKPWVVEVIQSTVDNALSKPTDPLIAAPGSEEPEVFDLDLP